MAPLAALAAAVPEMIGGATAAAGLTAADTAAAVASAGAAAAPWAAGTTVTAADAGTGLGTILSGLGTAATVGGTLASGIAAKNQANYAADQEKKAAADKLAAGTRQADDQRRRTNILISDEKASAAASGAGVSNPTVLDILSDTAGRGEFLQNSDIYNGQAGAASDLDQAALLKARGSGAMTGSWLDALGEGTLGGYKTGKSAGLWG